MPINVCIVMRAHVPQEACTSRGGGTSGRAGGPAGDLHAAVNSMRGGDTVWRARKQREDFMRDMPGLGALPGAHSLGRTCASGLSGEIETEDSGAIVVELRRLHGRISQTMAQGKCGRCASVLSLQACRKDL